MKTLLLIILAVTAACKASPAVERIPAPRSLGSLLKDAIRTELKLAKDTFDELSELWGDLDWHEATNLTDVFGVAPCTKLCHVCWMIPFQTASEKCEDFCEDTCDYDFEKNDTLGTGRGKRSLIELCLGLGSLELKLGGGRGGGGGGLLGGVTGLVGGLLNTLTGGGLLGGLLGGENGGLLNGLLGGGEGGLLGGLLGGEGGLLGGEGGLLGGLLGGGGGEGGEGGLLGGLLGGGAREVVDFWVAYWEGVVAPQGEVPLVEEQVVF